MEKPLIIYPERKTIKHKFYCYFIGKCEKGHLHSYRKLGDWDKNNGSVILKCTDDIKKE